MGRQVHVKQKRKSAKLFGGVKTADEVWREMHALSREKCRICKSEKIAIRIRVFVEHDEVVKRAPSLAGRIMAANPDGPYIPTTPMRWGSDGKVYRMVRVSDSAFCDHCRKTAELEAAKGPSWALVEIDRGPGQDKIISQVPRTIFVSAEQRAADAAVANAVNKGATS